MYVFMYACRYIIFINVSSLTVIWGVLFVVYNVIGLVACYSLGKAGGTRCAMDLRDVGPGQVTAPCEGRGRPFAGSDALWDARCIARAGWR
jgi:hypothetical protein